MSELLLKTVVEKLENLETEIQKAKGDGQVSPDYTAQLEAIKAEIAKVQTGLEALRGNLQFPIATIVLLSKRLEDCTMKLQQPVKQDIVHRHHLNWGIAVSAALILILAVFASWIFNLYQRMDAYQANDIKYRHLRLQGNGPIQDLLYETDSLYQAEAEKMKRSVSHEEEARQRRMELRLEADRKEQEARRLREEARRR